MVKIQMGFEFYILSLKLLSYDQLKTQNLKLQTFEPFSTGVNNKFIAKRYSAWV